MMRQAVNSIPGAKGVIQDISQGGFSASRGGGFPVEFNIRGRDWDTLAKSAREIRSRCGSRASSPTWTATTRWACPRCRWSPTATRPPTSA